MRVLWDWFLRRSSTWLQIPDLLSSEEWPLQSVIAYRWDRRDASMITNRGPFQYKDVVLPVYPMLKTRWSRDRLILNMGNLYPERPYLYWDGAQVVCWPLELHQSSLRNAKLLWWVPTGICLLLCYDDFPSMGPWGAVRCVLISQTPCTAPTEGI